MMSLTELRTPRAIAAFFAVSMLTLFATAQLRKTETTKPVTAEQIISRTISRGISEGHDAKILGGMGEPAAAIVVRLTKNKKLSAAEADGVLVILNISFAGTPSLGSERKQSIALALLRRLDASTNDVALKQRVKETTQVVQGKYAERAHHSVAAAPPSPLSVR